MAINSALTVGAPQTWTVASGKQLTISGSLNLNISPLTIVGGGNTLISGPIHDASTDPLLGGTWTGPVGTLTMDGSGLLTLTGSNTYTGGTTVAAGTLKLDFSQGGCADCQHHQQHGGCLFLGLERRDLAIQGKLGMTNSQQFNGLTVNRAVRP